MKFPTVMPRYCYSDPSLTVKFESETKCTGCQHETKILFGKAAFFVCDVPKRKHGKRCAMFKRKDMNEAK